MGEDGGMENQGCGKDNFSDMGEQEIIEKMRFTLLF